MGVSLVTEQHWYIFNKLNIYSIFVHFSLLTVFVVNRSRSYYLNAFCLCILSRHFLVHETNHIDRRMCLVVSDLRARSLIGMILVETLNGLDVVHRKEANFFDGSPLLLQV